MQGGRTDLASVYRVSASHGEEACVLAPKYATGGSCVAAWLGDWCIGGAGASWGCVRDDPKGTGRAGGGRGLTASSIQYVVASTCRGGGAWVVRVVFQP